jgi:hypothetical protein
MWWSAQEKERAGLRVRTPVTVVGNSLNDGFEKIRDAVLAHHADDDDA